MNEMSRLAGAALVPYHLGRAATYAFLGLLAALLAGSTIAVTGLRWISAGLLLLAALFLLMHAFPALGLSTKGGGGWALRVTSLARPLFAAPFGWKGFALGLLLGFIPCGLLYGALAASAASGKGLGGAFAMLAFALGTVPGLLAVGWAGHLAARRWNALGQKMAPFLLILNAGVLAYLAWSLIA
jgi:sulfite exporter TauE/SafE